MSGSLDEGTLRERFPEIPWDQPVILFVPFDFEGTLGYGQRWACRYCIPLYRTDEKPAEVFLTRQQALDHIEREHHD